MKTNQKIAYEVLMGIWGNGSERRQRLTEAGYDYDAVQSIVNALVEGRDIPQETVQTELKIIGTHYLDIDVDLNEYKGINLTFTMGGDDDADSSSSG